MTNWEDVAAYAGDMDAVKNDLASALYRGELALLLGAGVSKPFGLPSWPKLVRDCLESVSLPHAHVRDDATFDELTKAAGLFRDKCKTSEYRATIHRHLYAGHARKLPTPLLSAVGALLMGSRRGCIREVWTLNYDDVLEWHLRRHGFVSQVVTATPCLRRDTDVTIYHPHGYIPLEAAEHADSEIVFDDRSYAKRGLGNDQPWRTAVQWALRSKVFITVGLSWNDGLLKGLLLESFEDIKDRPTAFWFFGPGQAVDETDCHRHNVAPLQFTSFDDYASFLLEICERAMLRVE